MYVCMRMCVCVYVCVGFIAEQGPEQQLWGKVLAGRPWARPGRKGEHKGEQGARAEHTALALRNQAAPKAVPTQRPGRGPRAAALRRLVTHTPRLCRCEPYSGWAGEAVPGEHVCAPWAGAAGYGPEGAEARPLSARITCTQALMK